MSAYSLKAPDQKTQDKSNPVISDSCIVEFNKLSHKRRIKILMQLNINVKSFTQFVFNEKRAIFTDIKQMVDDSKRENEVRESNAKQIERKYGEIIGELYADKVSVKYMAVHLAKFEQIENADSKLNVSESIVRNVIRNMNIQRVDDRKQGKHKPKKKALKRSARLKTDAQSIKNQMTDIETADAEQIEKQIVPGIENSAAGQLAEQMTDAELVDGEQLEEQIVPEIESTDVEQIEKQIDPGNETAAADQLDEQMTEAQLVDGEQLEKQIDPEIENVQLDDLGTESDT